MAAQGFPSWQVLLVDLRCHGESTQMAQRPARPHGVESAAEDVLKLLGQLKLFPEVLVGHSFGGKVVMSMVEQFGRLGSRLPRPVQARPRPLCPSCLGFRNLLLVGLPCKPCRRAWGSGCKQLCLS